LYDVFVTSSQHENSVSYAPLTLKCETEINWKGGVQDDDPD